MDIPTDYDGDTEMDIPTDYDGDYEENTYRFGISEIPPSLIKRIREEENLIPKIIKK